MTERWSHARTVLKRRCLGGTVVLDAAGDGEPARLLGTAAEAWELLDQPLTVDDLAFLMGVRYELDAAVVRADLVNLLEGLAERGLVTRTD